MKDPRRVVLLSATWSVACRQLEVRLRRAGLRVRVVDVDTSEGHALRAAHGIETLPAAFVRQGTRLLPIDGPSVRTVRAALARAPVPRSGVRPRSPISKPRKPCMHLAPRVQADDLLAYDPARAARRLHPFQEDLVEALARRACPPTAGRRLLLQVATGGGKTTLTNEWLARYVLPAGRRVLWVTRDWELLRQAAHDLCQRHREGLAWATRLGDGLRGLPEGGHGAIVYTTTQSFAGGRGAALRPADFDYVVIDELHWGEGRGQFRRLERRFAGATFVGLTATPRRSTEYELVGRAWGFAELVAQGVLARAEVVPARETGVRWRPRRNGEHGDFTATSLRELAAHDGRDELIVRAYLEGSPRYGKTLAFACDVAHCEALARRFRAHGVAAEYVHCGLRRADREAVLARFRSASGGVLVNVAMLAQGVDVPDVDTILLARPTASPILFSQMVGRGARRAPGKDRFFVVDFVDVLEEHGDLLIRPADLFDAAGRGRASPRARGPRGPRLARHAYEPAEFLVHVPRAGDEALAGLELQPAQTFGVELELTRADFDGEPPEDWEPVAEDLLEGLRAALGAGLVAGAPFAEHSPPEKDDGLWNVEYDGSCGWEVTSRVLQGEAGVEELTDACRAVSEVAERLGLFVDRRTGTHVHLGWRPDAARLRRLFDLVACFEPALLSLVPPSRHRNPYCASIRAMRGVLDELRTRQDWRDAFEEPDSRYVAVNPRGLVVPGGRPTLEVRLHSGTTEARKLLFWISLWMRIVSAADRGVRPPAGLARVPDEQPLSEGPQGDVVELVRLLGGGAALGRALAERRAEVMARSWERPGSPWAELAARVRSSWRAP